MKSKRVKSTLAMVLAVCAIVTSAVPAFAATSDPTQVTPVEVTTEAAIFDVVVPTALPVNVDNQGVVTVADDVKIINNSWGAIKIDGLAIVGQNDWVICDYDSADMAAERVNTKKIAMSINNDKTTGADAVSFNAENFPSLDGENDTESDELAIIYDAKVPAHSTAIEAAQVAQVTFTIAWDAL